MSRHDTLRVGVGRVPRPFSSWLTFRSGAGEVLGTVSGSEAGALVIDMGGPPATRVPGQANERSEPGPAKCRDNTVAQRGKTYGVLLTRRSLQLRSQVRASGVMSLES